MRVLLMYNPTAGDDGVDADELASLLEAAGHAVEAQSLKENGWAAALGRDVDLTIVAGGDGAVAKVFKRLAGSGKLVALLPVGSANNIAKTLGYRGDESPAAVIERLDEAERGRFDVGSLRSARSGRAFVESAGSGVFTEMLLRAEAVDTSTGGSAKVELGLRLLRDVLVEQEARPWRVEADGVGLSGEFLAVEAMNVRSLGPNVPLAPGADPGDGLLELVLVRPQDRDELVAYAEARLAERSAPALELEIRRAERIEVGPPEGWKLHFDDELLEHVGNGVSISLASGLDVLRPPREQDGRTSRRKC
jgi:diacylglycerol kinase (ATP)